MATYYGKTTNSDIVPASSLFSEELSSGTTTAGSTVASVPNSSTASGYFVTSAGYPANAAWGTQAFTFVLNVTTASSAISATVRAHRINASGVIQVSSATTASQSLGSTGNKTFSIASTNYGTGACDDRLMIQVAFTSTNSHGGAASVTIGMGNATNLASSIAEFAGVCFPASVKNLRQYSTDHTTPIAVTGATGSGTDVNLDFDINLNLDVEAVATTPADEVKTTATSFTNTATSNRTVMWNPDWPVARRGAGLVYDSTYDRFIMWYGHDQADASYVTDAFELRYQNDKPKWQALTQFDSNGNPPTANGTTSATNRYYFAHCYAPGLKSAFMFGGYDGGDNNDMWVLDLSAGNEILNWWKQTPTGSIPPARSNAQHAMVHDDTTNTAYLFGGWGAAYYNDLYSYPTTAFNPVITQLKAQGAAGSPPGRRNHSVILDKANGHNRLIIFGGYASTAPVNDVWQYDLTSNTFTQLSPTGTAPTARELHECWHDKVNNRMVIWGGYDGGSTYYRDCFALDLSTTNGAWTKISASMDDDELPLATYGTQSAVDTKRNIGFGFGGIDQTGDPARRQVTINLNNTTNSEFGNFITNDFYRAMDAPSFAYNSDRGEFMIAGGYQELTDGSTVNFGGHGSSSFVYNPTSNEWRLASGGLLTFPQREGALLVYDSTQKRFLLFGGLSGDGLGHNDLWEAKANANGDYIWKRLTPTGTKPTGRWLMCGAFDAVHNRLIVTLGARGSSISNFNDVWECSFAGSSDGAWTQRTPTGTAPAARWAAAYHNQTSTNKLFIYGGSTSAGDTTYTNTFYSLDMSTTNCAWSAALNNTAIQTPLTQASAMTSMRSAALTYDSTDNVFVLFGGFDGTSVLNDVYIYHPSVDNWYKIQAGNQTNPPEARRSHAMFSTGNTVYITAGRPVSGAWYSNTYAGIPNATNVSSTETIAWTNKQPKKYQHASFRHSLANGDYHWQSWLTYAGTDSARVSFGANAETAIDFSVGSSKSTYTRTHSTDAYKHTSTSPTVTTSAATSIAVSSATGNGNVTADGGASVTSRGFVWSTKPNPSLGTAQGSVTAGSGTGTFSASMTGLAPHTYYYYSAYATNSNGTSYGTSQKFTTASLPTPSVSLNTTDGSTLSSATPTLTFTGTDPSSNDIEYQVQVDSVNTFGVIDSFAESEKSAGDTLNDFAFGLAQSFTGNGSLIGSAKWYLSKNGTPTGTATAKIYAHSGTFGSSSIPTGSALATSDAVDVSTISSSYSLVTFSFTGANQITLANATHYVLSIEYTGGTASDYILVGSSVEGGASGNASGLFSGSWLSFSNDYCFYVLTPQNPLIDKSSSVPDATFTNTINGADTHPFTSGDQIGYTIQSGNALNNGTYYWRVRANDPSSTSLYGSWSSTNTFTVSTTTPSFAKTHTTSSNKRKAVTRSHTTDAYRHSNTSPTVVLNSPSNGGSVSTSTPQFTFTGTDADNNDINYEVLLTQGSSSALIAEYPNSNFDSGNQLYSGFQTATAQSFIPASNTTLGSVAFYVGHIGTLSGTVAAKLYATTGSAGSKIPTGAALATSDTILANSLPDAGSGNSIVTFTFSGANQVALSSGTEYVIAFDVSGATTNSSNFATYNADASSPTAPGNNSTYNGSTWTTTTRDLIYSIYSPATQVTVLDKFSATDAGFSNVGTPGDTAPFTSGQQIQFTVQSANALTNGSYNLKVRGIDPSGTNTYGGWSSTNTFTVNVTALSFTKTHTTDAVKRKQTVTTHSTSSVIRKQSTKTHTTDALKKKAGILKTHTTDALKRKQNVRTHTTSSNKKKAGLTVSHSTDANKKKAALTKTHTTNALLRKQFTKSHTTDSLRRKQNTIGHTTDAIKKTRAVLSHTTDSFKRKSNTKFHTTSSVKHTVNSQSHTTDTILRGSSYYTRETNAALPTDKNPRSVGFLASEYATVASDDGVYVDQTGTAYQIFQFEKTNNNNTDNITVSWNGRTTLAPSTNAVYLQVYNNVSGSWETITSNATAAANTDFTLSGILNSGVSNYYDANYRVEFRVYQGVV